MCIALQLPLGTLITAASLMFFDTANFVVDIDSFFPVCVVLVNSVPSPYSTKISFPSSTSTERFKTLFPLSISSCETFTFINMGFSSTSPVCGPIIVPVDTFSTYRCPVFVNVTFILPLPIACASVLFALNSVFKSEDVTFSPNLAAFAPLYATTISSFSCAIIDSFLAFFDFFISPLSPRTRLILIPANNNNTTIVTTKAIKVIALLLFSFCVSKFVCSFSFSFSIFRLLCFLIFLL